MPKEFPLDSEGFNPFGELIGLRFSGCGEGVSQCVLEVSERLLNPHNVLHGGVLYSMADTGMGAALYSMLKEDELCTTVDVKIMYLKPVTSGTVRCETKVLKRARSVAILESDISSDGELVAKATGTFYIY